jgi:hypothetical protein
VQVLGENISSEKIAPIYELLHKAETYNDPNTADSLYWRGEKKQPKTNSDYIRADFVRFLRASIHTLEEYNQSFETCSCLMLFSARLPKLEELKTPGKIYWNTTWDTLEQLLFIFPAKRMTTWRWIISIYKAGYPLLPCEYHMRMVETYKDLTIKDLDKNLLQ